MSNGLATPGGRAIPKPTNNAGPNGPKGPLNTPKPSVENSGNSGTQHR